MNYLLSVLKRHKLSLYRDRSREIEEHACMMKLDVTLKRARKNSVTISRQSQIGCPMINDPLVYICLYRMHQLGLMRPPGGPVGS